MKHTTIATGVVTVVAFLGVVAWLHDFITLDGARTVDGLTVCRRLRSRQVTTPILVLTARDQVSRKSIIVVA